MHFVNILINLLCAQFYLAKKKKTRGKMWSHVFICAMRLDKIEVILIHTIFVLFNRKSFLLFIYPIINCIKIGCKRTFALLKGFRQTEELKDHLNETKWKLKLLIFVHCVIMVVDPFTHEYPKKQNKSIDSILFRFKARSHAQ